MLCESDSKLNVSLQDALIRQLGRDIPYQISVLKEKIKSR
jgi:hypothetical protein